MTAVITGASSGIGREMAVYLSEKGYDLVVAARRADRLEELKSALPTRVEVVTADVSKEEECRRLHALLAGRDVEILINNAGFGLLGDFAETDLDRELAMIDTNLRAVHILTKLFLRDFKAKNRGYILNVASAAGFAPGPLMATYYATKAYVLRLSMAIGEELRQCGSRVYVGALCPGPVHTEFGRVADVNFAVKGLESPYVARYAVDRMLAGKRVIVPGKTMGAARVLSKLLPDGLVMRAVYAIQKRK